MGLSANRRLLPPHAGCDGSLAVQLASSYGMNQGDMDVVRWGCK